jgi:hypothetical protein
MKRRMTVKRRWNVLNVDNLVLALMFEAHFSAFLKVVIYLSSLCGLL